MSNSKFTESPAKFLSIFVERMVPDYVREDHPQFIEFLRKYFEYLERETGVNGELGEYKQITDLIENVDIDHAMDLFIPEFEKQYLRNIPSNSIDPTVPTTDKAFLTKNILPTYREKGTVKAIDFLFRRDFNTEANVIYPKQYLMTASGSVWYEPKWINVTGQTLLDTSESRVDLATDINAQWEYRVFDDLSNYSASDLVFDINSTQSDGTADPGFILLLNLKI